MNAVLPPLHRSDPCGSCIFIYSVVENEVFLHVMKRVDLERIMPKSKKPKKTALPHPVGEVQLGTQIQLSLHHEDGRNAYSTATSWLVMKAVPVEPFENREDIDDAVEALGEIADGLVKSRVETQAGVVKLKPEGLHKPDNKLDKDDLFDMSEMEEESDDDDDDVELI